MAVVRQEADRRKGTDVARERDPVLVEDVFHSRSIAADDGTVGEHQGLVAVADVIAEQTPFERRPWLDNEHRLLTFDQAAA